MDIDLVQQTIEIYFAANYVLTKYQFQDIPFESGQEPLADESWVRLVVVMGLSEPLEIGNNGLGVRNGTINVEIFCPLDQPREKYEIAKVLEALFRRKSISGIVTYEPYTSFLTLTTTVVASFHVLIGE